MTTSRSSCVLVVQPHSEPKLLYPGPPGQLRCGDTGPGQHVVEVHDIGLNSYSFYIVSILHAPKPCSSKDYGIFFSVVMDPSDISRVECPDTGTLPPDEVRDFCSIAAPRTVSSGPWVQQS